MKKIMILGAGIYQVPLIKKARELGLYTIVVSIPGNYPGFQFADKIYYENTTDTEAVSRIAQDEKIDGVVTTGTDVAVISLGTVCDLLGLKGVSKEGATIACDKKLMKKVYAQDEEISTAKFVYQSLDGDLGDIQRVCETIGYPVIFKAVDSSGSRGITRVDSGEDIPRAIEAVREVTRVREYIIEKFLVGYEFGAQAFVQDGKVEFVLPHGDFVFNGDTGVPIGHYAPFDQPEIEAETMAVIAAAIRAMKLNNCAINADFIYADGRVYVLEIGARGGATQLVELVSLYYGFDYYEKIIRVAMGEHVDFSPENESRVANASHLIMSEKSGIISDIVDENPEDPDIIEVSFDYSVGDRVNAFRVGPDRIGHVITVGRDLQDAKDRVFRALENIEVKIRE